MNEFKLIVAGGRDFNDAELLSRTLYAMADVELADKSVSIVSSMARGADALGYQFAQLNSIKCYPFVADCYKHGKYASFVRNDEMAQFSDGLLAFHDRNSKETAHLINTMRSMRKPVTVINY